MVGYDSIHQASLAQLNRYTQSFSRSRFHHMIHLVPMGQAPGDLLDGINLRDVAEQPWLDHRTTLMAGRRHQVYLMVVAVGRALAIEQHGLVWRRLHEGYVLQMHLEDHG